MQPTISKFFLSKAVAKPVAARDPQHVEIIDLCDTDDQPLQSKIITAVEMDLSLVRYDAEKHSGFAKAVLGAFDHEDNPKADETCDAFTVLSKTKYTPLELQVLEIRRQYPDTLLMVECGYRVRFFGDDAVNAARVLSIYAHMDHHFMVASVPTFRLAIHCKRLVAAGYKVAIVRQTETVALRKASKSKSAAAASNTSSSTFSRDVAGVFSPGCNVDSADPAFLGLAQTSNAARSHEGKDEDDDDGTSDVDACSDTEGLVPDAGVDEVLDDLDSEDVWITSVYEEVNDVPGAKSQRTVATASVNIAAHAMQCAYFQGEQAVAQALDHLDIIKPKEIIYNENISAHLQSALEAVRCVSGTSQADSAGGRLRYVVRLAPIAVLKFLTDCVRTDRGDETSVAKKDQAGGDSSRGSGWIYSELPQAECKYAVFGLHSYLTELKLQSALIAPALELHLPLPDAPHGVATAAVSPAAAFFKLDVVTAKDLEVFQASGGGLSLTNSNLAAGFADLVQQRSTPQPKHSKRSASGSLSLFAVINHCKTAFGRRTLRHWLLHPLCLLDDILARQQASRWLAELVANSGRGASLWISKIFSIFSSFGDIEKFLTALRHLRILPHGMLRLFDFAQALGELHGEFVGTQNAPTLISRQLENSHCVDVAKQALILRGKLNTATTAEDAVTDVFTAAAVRDFRELCSFRDQLAATEAELAAELINIRVQLKMPNLTYKSLRTGPVSSIEHLIEVPTQMSTRIPSDWIRSNCTKQVERYHSPVVLALQDRLYLLRDEIKRAAKAAWGAFVQQVRTLICAHLQSAVEALGVVDALLSLAKLSTIPGYVQPTFVSTNNSVAGIDELIIVGGRHPVVEKFLERECEHLIPNDVHLSCNYRPRSAHVITGPNMGGKSSYVRMVALICLMAQVGACVPAESAKLCIFDRIFTRMGAGDDLAEGHSTFMSELHRTNFILQRATPHSLVILDELGRGTATNDGLAIAQATLNYLLRRLGCAVLFVTHFPQIADLVERSNFNSPTPEHPSIDEGENRLFPHAQAVNIHMGYLREKDSMNVMFLYKAVEGPSRGSYGLNVARLAGIPDRVLALATQNAAWMRAGRGGAISVPAEESVIGDSSGVGSKRKLLQDGNEH